jgi:gas vesicle protein GvpK
MPSLIMTDKLTADPAGSTCQDDLARAFSRPSCPSPSASAPGGLRIAFQPDDVKNGLGRLVLTVVELVRELLERQAIRRIEAGSLTDLEIERIGTTFLRLSEQMDTLKAAFGLEGQDLNLDLGPLGKLLDDPRR